MDTACVIVGNFFIFAAASADAALIDGHHVRLLELDPGLAPLRPTRP